MQDKKERETPLLSLTDRNPFSYDLLFRNIATGLTAQNKLNVHAKELGQIILDSMNGNTTFLKGRTR